MGQDTKQTLNEIEQTRDELELKVDALVDRAKIEAAEVSKKLAIGAAALVGLLIVGMIAKRRVGT